MRQAMQEQDKAALKEESRQNQSYKRELGLRLFEKWSKKKNLGEGMDTMREADEAKAVRLSLILENQENHLQALSETVISGSFSTTPENVIRIVRLGYPNSVRGEIFHEFSMVTARDSIYYLAPVYNATARGATASDVTHESAAYRYASEVEEQIIALGDGSTVEFTGTLSNIPLRPFNVKVLREQEYEGTDDGSGNLTGTLLDSSATNTVNYTTGNITVTFTTAPSDGDDILIEYHYDSEDSDNYTDIKSVDLQLTDHQFRARPWPLYLSWSKMSELLLGTTLDIDAEAALIQGAADELKKSLDFQAVKTGYRYSLSNTLTSFNADFASAGSDSEVAHAQSLTRTISKASKVIYNSLQRGGVSTLVAGTDALPYLTLHQKFSSDNAQPQIGIYRAGTLMDLPVYQAPNSVIPADEIMGVWRNPNESGDVGIAFGTLIPLYQTQTLEFKEAYKQTGLMHFGDFKALQPSYMIRIKLNNLDL